MCLILLRFIPDWPRSRRCCPKPFGCQRQKNHSVAVENPVHAVQKVVLYMTGAEKTQQEKSSRAKLKIFSAAARREGGKSGGSGWQWVEAADWTGRKNAAQHRREQAESADSVWKKLRFLTVRRRYLHEEPVRAVVFRKII